MHKTLSLVLTIALLSAPAAWAKQAEPASPENRAKVEIKRAPAKGPAVEIRLPDRNAWLGVRMMIVPKALADHLRLKDTGVILSNIVVGSPADKAGLKRYDVILKVDAKEIDVDSIGKLIGFRKPGEKVTLDVVQAGQTKKIGVVLAKPAALDEAKMKYKEDPETVWQDQSRWHGRLFRRGPDGRWIGPGNVKPPAKMDEMLKRLKRDGDLRIEIRTHVDADGPGTVRTVKQVRDGKSIEIKRDRGGKITVTRTETPKDKSTKSVTTTKTYPDAEALRKGDPEAHRIFGGQGVRIFNVPGWQPMQPVPWREWTLPEDMTKELEKLKQQLEKEFKGRLEIFKRRPRDDAGQRNFDELRKDIDKRAREMFEKLRARTKGRPFRPFESDQIDKIIRGLTKPHRLVVPGGPDQPLRQFNVDEKGRIEVRIRKGDDEISLTFKNEQELKAKRPKLYEQYRKVLKDTD